MSTVHNSADKNQIASSVLMCGDPLRAKFIADNFLSDAKLVNTVRNMYCYTGKYNGVEVSVMGSGMGIPSISIYSYELFHFYDVKRIIRVGTCGSFLKDVATKEIIIAQGASSDSNYAYQFDLNGNVSANSSFSLLNKAHEMAKKMNLKYHVGNILTSDIFYHEDKNHWRKWANMGVLAVEMETYGLYLNAMKANKEALTILTVSDNLETGEQTTSKERQESFKDMMILALNVAIAD